MIKIVTEDQFSYYTRVLSLISALSPTTRQLTAVEVETLAHFLSLPPKFDYFPFTAQARKLIYAKYNPPLTVSMLSSRITSLISKGYLVRDEDNFVDFSPNIRKIRRTSSFHVEIQATTTIPKDSDRS